MLSCCLTSRVYLVCLKVRALSCVTRWGYVFLLLFFAVCVPEGAIAVVCLTMGVCFV